VRRRKEEEKEGYLIAKGWKEGNQLIKGDELIQSWGEGGAHTSHGKNSLRVVQAHLPDDLTAPIMPEEHCFLYV